MNEEIEYAEMLEIPVSTVNVIHKKQRRKIKQEGTPSAVMDYNVETAPLKDSVIAQVNDRINETQSTTQEDAEGLNFDPIPERIDTVRLYSTEETNGLWRDGLYPHEYDIENQNEGGRYAMNIKNRIPKAMKIAFNTEFIAACALCGAIFLTNVFMPNSAINTFFRSIGTAAETEQVDTRPYTDFTLSPVVSELSNTEISLSPAGILSFTDNCCVYPAVNGIVQGVTQNEDGSYNIKIAHSDTFTGIISGLDYVYYAEGDEVKTNVPIGYSEGENEVQVTMYSGGILLNCFQLTEENCLAWIEAAQ